MKKVDFNVVTDWEKGLIGWDSPEDPANPKNWSSAKKWRTMGLVAVSCFMLPLASTLFAPGVEYVILEFHQTNATVETFMISIFVLGFGWGPLLCHAPMSELFGRKYVICVSNLVFALFNIGCSEAHNTATFMACRFLGGFLGCAAMVVGGGVIGDMFKPQQMGRAASIFALGPLMGPVVGPVAGGFIAETIGWRWTFRILLILGMIMTVLFFVLVEETSAPAILRVKARRLRKEHNRSDLISHIDKGRDLRPAVIWWQCFSRPLRLLFTNPIVTFAAVYMGFAFAYLYMFVTTITYVFRDYYGFSTGLTGLAYLGLGTGLMIGVSSVGATSDKLVAYLTKKNNGVRQPEFRLRPLYLSCLCIPASMFWYGWAIEQHRHWIAVILSMIPMGIGMVSSMLPIQTYLIEVFAPYGFAPSATAAGNCLRMTAGAFFPLCGTKLYASLGFGWGCSLLGFLAFGCCGSMALAFNIYGQRLRVAFPPKL
ncbi:major facilitator superfamily domain-containing protein [Dipodascopsis tothii]|uniref:major facilitator superfamily domain-containing protein n=1 Tax=Dipodascopsis tothii TaxID=44089 RepID=UPI0034CEA61E